MGKSGEKQSHYSEDIDPRESGTWRSGISNPEMRALFGELIGDWVHIEEFDDYDDGSASLPRC